MSEVTDEEFPMETPRLAALTRFFSVAASRRGMLAGLTGGLLATGVISLDEDDAEARKKDKRRKKRKNKNTKPKAKVDAFCAGLTGSSGMSIGSPEARLAQTFTALRSGQLVRAEVQISELSDVSGDFLLHVAAVDDSGVPTNELLASAMVADQDVPDGTSTVAFVFSNPATVEAGTQYALILTRPGAESLLWVGDRGNPCGGRTFDSNSQTVPFEPFAADIDVIFTTFVRS
jgi:hypothetical protein